MSLVPVPVCGGCAKAAQVAISCSECMQISCGSCFGLQESDNHDTSQSRFISLLTARVCTKCTADQTCSSSSNIKNVLEVTIEPELKPEAELQSGPEVESQQKSAPESELKPKPEAEIQTEPTHEAALQSEPKAESQPKSALECEPKPKNEAALQSQPETESQPQLKSAPEPESKSKSEAALQSEPETVSHSKSTPQPQLKSAPKPESESKSEAESQPEPKSAPEPESESTSKVALQSEPEAESHPKSTPQPQPKSAPEPESKSEAESQPEPKSAPEPESESTSKVALQSESEAESHPKSTPKSAPEPESKSEAESQPEPKPQNPEPAKVNAADKHDLCRAHGKEMNLFCLTCQAIICGDCFLAGGAHMRHQIDFVEAVFKEKRLETKRKLARLEEKVGVLQREAAHSAINLTTIRSAEQAVLDEIDAICEEAKMSVNRLTMNRKRKLEARAQFPAKKQKLTETLVAMIDQMSPAEFIQKQAEVYKQCDALITDCTPKGFFTLQFEDVGCELVPKYEMQTYTLMNFDGTFAGWPQHLTTTCGTMWNAFLRKKESLFIKVSPYEAEASKHPYKLLVILPHLDISKTLTKTFIIHGTPKEDEIASVEYIQEQGFMRKNKELVVKVGLRPLNAITENRFLKNHCRALKSTITDMEKQVTSSGKDINCQFCIMHFTLSLAKTPKKSPEAHHSEVLVDRQERHWCLRVYPFAQTLEETNLKVFVVLRKGTRTKCRYFIELLHDDPKKNVIQCTESAFDTIDAGYGWHCFMERKRLLSDAGFYSGGVLRFRFGVQPLDK